MMVPAGLLHLVMAGLLEDRIPYSQKYLRGTKFCEFAVTVKIANINLRKINFLHKTWFCACAVTFPSE